MPLSKVKTWKEGLGDGMDEGGNTMKGVEFKKQKTFYDDSGFSSWVGLETIHNRQFICQDS
jgi:hypothetical protein